MDNSDVLWEIGSLIWPESKSNVHQFEIKKLGGKLWIQRHSRMGMGMGQLFKPPLASFPDGTALTIEQYEIACMLAKSK